MFGTKSKGGYTIVEVMMFLAVSGGLFVIAMVVLNGRQNQVQFTQGVRDFQSSVEDVLNDVATGYFPQNNSYKCSAPGGVLSFTLGTAAGQGEHDQCTFLGKVLHFERDSNAYSLISVAGVRLTASGQAASNFADAKPKAIHDVVGNIDLTESFTIKGGVVVTDVIMQPVSPDLPYKPAAFGIFSSLGEQNAGTSAGVLTTNIVSVPTSSNSPSDDISDTRGKIAFMSTDPPLLNKSIVVCLRQGGIGGKRAAIIIGSNNRQVFTELAIGDIETKVDQAIGGATCP